AVVLANLVLGHEPLHARHEVPGLDPRTHPRWVLAALEMPQGHHGEEDHAPDEGDADPQLFLLARRAPPDARRRDERRMSLARVHARSFLRSQGSGAFGRLRISYSPQSV